MFKLAVGVVAATAEIIEPVQHRELSASVNYNNCAVSSMPNHNSCEFRYGEKCVEHAQGKFHSKACEKAAKDCKGEELCKHKQFCEKDKAKHEELIEDKCHDPLHDCKYKCCVKEYGADGCTEFEESEDAPPAIGSWSKNFERQLAEQRELSSASVNYTKCATSTMPSHPFSCENRYGQACVDYVNRKFHSKACEKVAKGKGSPPLVDECAKDKSQHQETVERKCPLDSCKHACCARYYGPGACDDSEGL